MSGISRTALFSITLGAALLTAGTASAGSFPVASGYDSGWVGKSFRARDLPMVDQALTALNNALDVPVLGRIATVDMGADLHGYVHLWMQPNRIGVRGETTAWMGASLRYVGGGTVGGYPWVRVNGEASAYTDPLMSCAGCSEWTAQALAEVINSGTMLWYKYTPGVASVDYPVKEELAIAPIPESYEVPLGIIGDAYFHLETKTSIKLAGPLRATPVTSSVDLVANATAFVDLELVSYTLAGVAYVHARIDALGDNVYDANNDGVENEADAPAMYSTPATTRTRLQGSLGTAQYDISSGWKMCPSVRAEVWSWNAMLGSVFVMGTDRNNNDFMHYTPFGGTPNFHEIVAPQLPCIPLLHMPF